MTDPSDLGAPNDLTRVRAALEGVGARARDLPWGEQRPWTPHTHVGLEGELLVVDLHDLSVRLGVEVTEEVMALADTLQTGAICLVTGAGRHAGGRSTLRDAVVAELEQAVVDRGWALRSRGPARFLLIWDMERAPPAASGALGPLFWGFVVLVVAALAILLWTSLTGA